MILLATLGFGTVPMLAQLMTRAGFGADAITLYRFLVPFLLFLSCFKPRGLDPMETLRTLSLGIFCGIGMVLFMRALSQTSATTVILLYYCYPFFSILLGTLLFGQRLTRNSFATALLILVAASLTLSPESLIVEDLPLILGSLLAPISFALMIQYLARPLKPMATNQRMVISLSGTLLVVIPLTLVSGPVDLLPATPEAYAWILAIGVLSAALPQYLFARGAPLAGASSTASLSSLEVVVAMLMAVLVLGQQPDRMQLTAAILIIIAQLIRQELTSPAPETVAARQAS